METKQARLSMSEGGGPSSERKKKRANQKTEKEGSGDTHISPRDLKIVWGSDDKQWKIGLSKDLSYAEAINVMWFEVKATHKGAKPGNKYQIGFNITLKPKAFGWESCPLFLMAKIGDSGSYTWRKLYLNTNDVDKRFNFPNNFEIEIPNEAEDTTLHFGLYEIWAGRWKGGLLIHHAYVTKVLPTP